MSSMGVIFVMFLIGFITTVGIKAFGNTSFSFGTTKETYDMTPEDWKASDRYLTMFNKNFSPLAGILCAGYFLHTCSLPITRSAKYPEKNNRNIFLGYLMVFISYAVCGTLGYIGFMGTTFTDYFLENYDTNTRSQIN